MLIMQVYLLKHMYDLKRIPKEDFSLLLAYIEQLKGHSRDECLTHARKVASGELDPVSAPLDATDADTTAEPAPRAYVHEFVHCITSRLAAADEAAEDQDKLRKKVLKRARAVVTLLGGKDDQ